MAPRAVSSAPSAVEAEAESKPASKSLSACVLEHRRELEVMSRPMRTIILTNVPERLSSKLIMDQLCAEFGIEYSHFESIYAHSMKRFCHTAIDVFVEFKDVRTASHILHDCRTCDVRVSCPAVQLSKDCTIFDLAGHPVEFSQIELTSSTDWYLVELVLTTYSPPKERVQFTQEIHSVIAANQAWVCSICHQLTYGMGVEFCDTCKYHKDRHPLFALPKEDEQAKAPMLQLPAEPDLSMFMQPQVPLQPMAAVDMATGSFWPELDPLLATFPGVEEPYQGPMFSGFDISGVNVPSLDTSDIDLDLISPELLKHPMVTEMDDLVFDDQNFQQALGEFDSFLN